MYRHQALIIDTAKNVQAAQEQLADFKHKLETVYISSIGPMYTSNLKIIYTASLADAFDLLDVETFYMVISNLFSEEENYEGFPVLGERFCMLAIGANCHRTAVFSHDTPKGGWLRLHPTADRSTPFYDFTGEACPLREDGSKDWRAVAEKLR